MAARNEYIVANRTDTGSAMDTIIAETEAQACNALPMFGDQPSDGLNGSNRTVEELQSKIDILSDTVSRLEDGLSSVDFNVGSVQGAVNEQAATFG